MTQTQTPAQMYLADQRGYSETPFVRSFHTFNFGHYVAAGREPFGPLYLLNDDTLRAGAQLSMQLEQPTTLVLLPVVGGLEFRANGLRDFLEPGQTVTLSFAAGGSYTVSNPYETEFINFLQFWLVGAPERSSAAGEQTGFDIGQKNALQPLFTADAARGFIGRYDGRQDATYPIRLPADQREKRLFVFVLQGAFEVANRLLHERDALALRYERDDELEFEALSGGAILLLIDLTMTD